jgi:hypothetical protein
MPRPKSGNPLWEPVALKLPRELLAELRRYADVHRMTLSEVLREGLILRLNTTQEVKEYNGYTLAEDTSEDALTLDQLRQVLREELAAILTPVAPIAQSITVIPAMTSAQPQADAEIPEQVEKAPAPRKGGRPWSAVAQSIAALLEAHPEGLTAEQIRAFLQPEKPVGDTLQSLKRGEKVRTQGAGKVLRYFVA